MTTIGIVSKREGSDAVHASAASSAADDAEPLNIKKESEEEDKFSLINMHHHTKLCVDSDMGAPPPLPRWWWLWSRSTACRNRVFSSTTLLYLP